MTSQPSQFDGADEDGCARDASLLQAMRWMSEKRQSLAPILGAGGKLVGVVTDGDIRRGLVRGVSLESPVSEVMTTEPIIARDEMEEHEMNELLRSRRLVSAPVVDRSGRFVRMAQLNSHMIPNCVPHCTGMEQVYVAEAIAGGWLAVGPYIQRFEKLLAEYCGAKHAVALSSGTAALHLALLAAGVRPGDRVLAPTFTFAATVNAIVHCGAEPIFIDVDPATMGPDFAQAVEFLEQECDLSGPHPVEKSSGAPVRAIIPTHIYGHPCDGDVVRALCDRFGLLCIDDAAEALGAIRRGSRLGGDTDIACLSFNGNKIITGGGGGMVLCRDDAIARRVRSLAAQAKSDSYEFEHGEIGFNYRMPNLMAAVAFAQAETLDQRLESKRRIVQRYAEELEGLEGVSIWREASWAKSACWMAVLQFDEARYPDAKEELRYFASARGIEVRPVWKPLHAQAPYARYRAANINVAERLHRGSICLPCSVGLSDEDLRLVARVVREFFSLFSERRR